MTYRELFNSSTDEELAEILANDDLFNIACVENYDFNNNTCKYGYKDCQKCILALLKSDVEKDTITRSNMQD